MDQGNSVTHQVTLQGVDDGGNGDTLTVSFSGSLSATISSAEVSDSGSYTSADTNVQNQDESSFEVTVPGENENGDITVDVTLDTSTQSASALTYDVTASSGSGSANGDFKVNQVLDTVEVSQDSSSKTIDQGDSLSVDLVNAQDLAGDQFKGTADVTFGTESLSGQSSDVTKGVDFSSGDASGVQVFSDTSNLHDQTTSVNVNPGSESFELTVNQVLSSFSVSDPSVDQGDALTMDFTGATDLASQPYTQSGESITVRTGSLTGTGVSDSTVTVDFSDSTGNAQEETGVQILNSGDTENLESQTTSIDADADSSSASTTSSVTVNQVANSITATTDGTATADGTDQVKFTVTVNDYTDNGFDGASVSVDEGSSDLSGLDGISSDTTGTTGSNGEVTFTATSTDSGDYTVQFSSSAGDLSSATAQATATFEAGTPDSLSITSTPDPIQAGDSFEITVQATDADNNPAADKTLTNFDLSHSTDGSLIGDSSNLNLDADGKATVSVSADTATKAQNSYTLTATSSETGDATQDITVNPAPASQITAGSTEDVATESSRETGQFTVSASDEFGNSVQGETISIDDADGLGITGESNTDSTGQFMVSYTTESAGTYNPQFSLSDDSTTDTATVTVNPADADSLTAQDTSVEAGSQGTITVQATDQFDNDAEGDTINVVSNSDSLSDISSNSQTVSGGTAEFTFTENTADSYDIQFGIGSSGTTDTATVTVNAAATNSVTVSDDAEDLVLQGGETVDFSAIAKDEFDNVVTDSDSDFTWSPSEVDGETGKFSSSTSGTYDVTATYEEVTSSGTTVTVDTEDPSISNVEDLGDVSSSQPSFDITMSGVNDGTNSLSSLDTENTVVTVTDSESNSYQYSTFGDGNVLSVSDNVISVDMSNSEENLAEGSVDVEVEAQDVAGNSNTDSKSEVFTVDTIKPSVDSVQISDKADGNGVVKKDDSVRVEVNITEETSGVDTVTVDYSEFVTDSGTTTISTSDQGSSDYAGTFTVGEPTIDEEKQVTVTATDKATNGGSQDQASEGTLTVDNEVPSIESVEVEEGSRKATVEFSEPVSTDTDMSSALTASDFTYSDGSNGLVDGVIEVSHRVGDEQATLVFNSQINSEDLSNDDLAFTGDVVDEAGNTNEGSVGFSDDRDQISLTEGWNLVSTPQLQAESTSELLSGVEYSGSPLTYDDGQWVESASEMSLDEMDAVYINSEKPQEIELDRDTDVQNTPQDEVIETGWNLVGPSLNVEGESELNANINVAFNGADIGDDDSKGITNVVSPLGNWDQKKAEGFNDVEVEAFRGYWVFSKSQEVIS